MAPTIRDVAQRARVSEATVSRALRGLRHVAPETAAEVRRAAEELGFTPSRSAAALATGRQRSVSVVLPSVLGWFYADVLEGVDGALRERGYTVSLLDLHGASGERMRLTQRLLQEGHADAHVVIGFDLDADERRVVRAATSPVVTVGGTVSGVRGVGVNETAAARLALDHLIALGHRRIAHLGADREQGVNPQVTRGRRQAWLSALDAITVTPHPSWFASGGFRLGTSRDAAERMLALAVRPTAVFAASDEMAFGVLLAAGQGGLQVPEDLSVVGIDDHPYSSAYGLTTVRQSPADQGARAVAMLLRELEGGRRLESSVRAPLELIVRSSTAPPPPV